MLKRLLQRGISGSIAKRFELGFAAPGWSNLFDNYKSSEESIQDLVVMGMLVSKKDKENDYGFIQSMSGEDVFVHISAIQNGVGLSEDELVIFEFSIFLFKSQYFLIFINSPIFSIPSITKFSPVI